MDLPVPPTDLSLAQSLTLRELGELLIKHYGYHDGLWDVAVEFQLAFGRVGPSPESALPGAILGVSRVGLARAEQSGPGTIDASTINPPDGMPAYQRTTGSEE